MNIAVDFDGTIVTNRYPDIGTEQPFAVETLRMLQQKHHHNIILWTVREGETLEQAVNWCRERGLEFYAVNRDYPEETLESNNHYSRKLKVDIFIDDRNIGGLPDWGTIYEILTKGRSWTGIMRERFKSSTQQQDRPRKRRWWEI